MRDLLEVHDIGQAATRSIIWRVEQASSNSINMNNQTHRASII